MHTIELESYLIALFLGKLIDARHGTQPCTYYYLALPPQDGIPTLEINLAR